MPEPTSYHGRLAGRVAIVTGAGAEGEDEIGIGRAIALVLAAEGASVACLDLDGSRAERTAQIIGERGGKAIGIAGDVGDPETCERTVAETLKAFGRLDVLVNNVGISMGQTLESIDLELWDRILRVNLTSAMLMSKSSVPAMKKAGGGSIVNISSIAGMRTLGAFAYGVSKAGMSRLSCEIALQHGRDGIRVNTVAPGHMATPHAMRVLPPESREQRRKVGPLGIEGDAWDIARAVLFLASDDARFINGVELAVDGGVTMLGALAGVALVAE